MIIKSIRNTDLFKSEDETTKSVIYGFDQEWYKTKWQRSAGCGPTVAASLIYYLQCSTPGFKAEKLNEIKEPSLKLQKLQLMEDVWKYVTPSLQGVNTTRTLYKGVLAYAMANGMNVGHVFIDVPRKKSLRPTFARLLSFIGEALDADAPVAFLNLHNGKEKLLYSWHWVTIIKLEYSEDGSAAFATIMDEGRLKRINLLQWFSKTKLGGGFVHFKHF